ncbi:MAG: RNA-binding S4 domain-containing protein [Saprospiraceae bacterium]|nr:RNA-binding S4 domain-containing protein [Saprospiraceae bacterium]MDW8229748.1 RNA-binding S4 domain-containing protein [Saprospiraceae bacterium]
MTKVRVDKWLWSVRIFKSRTLATEACKAGRVRIEGEPLKPSHLIGLGDILTVRKAGFNFQYRVLQVLEKRVGAPIAATCYEDITPAEERNKYNAWFLNAAGGAEKREKGAGRPTKKERRELDEFKESAFEWDLDEE